MELTPYLTIRQFVRCRVTVWCQERCGMGAGVSVASLITRYGIDTKVSDLVPKRYCRRCE